jgi:pilus assembly protein CpaC
MPISRPSLVASLGFALAVQGSAYADHTVRSAVRAPHPTSRQPAARTARAVAEEMTIVLGEIRLLPMPGKVTRVALGSGAVLSATTVDTNLLLIAEKVGATTLMVWSGGHVLTYRMRVVSHALAATRRTVEALIGDSRGIVLTEVGDDLVLSGLAHRETLARLNKMLAELPNVINNINEDQGSAFTRSVLFRLHFVEVNKSLLEQIGINWAKEANGPVFGAAGARTTGIYKNNGTTGGVFFGLATTITSRLRLGISDGDARVLASPELTARSGGKARLQVGGEIPIPLAGAFGATTVEYKPYGILFALEPQIDADNTITAKLSTELSQIDPSISVQGIPGFITRNTATEISIKPGEIVALSGLVNSELANSIDRVPALSRIPIFGRLFRSDDFRNRKTELIVFVEAEIIAAGDGLAGRLRDRGLAAKREFEARAEAAAPQGE